MGTSPLTTADVPIATRHPANMPHVVAWNLTRRCNLECAHCYISAGPSAGGEGELRASEFKRITEEILALNPAPFFILSGGEPLLRPDLEELAAYAADRGATVVVGTNGTLLTDSRISQLRRAGVTGVAVSVDSLNTTYHDRFRRGHGALADTLAAVERLTRQRLDFVVQTTVTAGNRSEIRELVEWAAAAGAVSFNAYFLVDTGRGERMQGLPPQEREAVLAELIDLHFEFLGRMMVRAKCAPQFMRLLYEDGRESPLLNYATRCPCGVQYCRITPDAKVTPCPYTPVTAGDLRSSDFATVWRSSRVFEEIRSREYGGRCGVCEYRSVCGGCRAKAFAETNDLMSEDPSCAYEPSGERAVIEPRSAATYGSGEERALEWDAAAEDRMRRIPSFVRGVVMRRVEGYARRRGLSRVTVELLGEVRAAMPVDFSKRKPFFLDND